MRLEASRPGGNAKSQVLHLAMLFSCAGDVSRQNVQPADVLSIPFVQQFCDAQLLVDRLMQDMCLAASRPGRNAKTRVLHLVMLLPCVK